MYVREATVSSASGSTPSTSNALRTSGRKDMIYPCSTLKGVVWELKGAEWHERWGGANFRVGPLKVVVDHVICDLDRDNRGGCNVDECTVTKSTLCWKFESAMKRMYSESAQPFGSSFKVKGPLIRLGRECHHTSRALRSRTARSEGRTRPSRWFSGPSCIV